MPAATGDYSDAGVEETVAYAGFSMLIVGFMEFVGSLSAGSWSLLKDVIPWLANPLILLSLYAKRTKRLLPFLVLSIASIFCASLYWVNPVVPCCEDGRHILATPKLGYYLWLASAIALFIQGLISIRSKS